MPWKKRTEGTMREEFAKRVKAQEKSKAALCREYGISRPTGDKWLARYEAGLPLENQSRAPLRVHGRIDEETEREIVALRKKYPAIGAVKLHRMLEQRGREDLPCTKTFHNVLRRNGLISASATQAATPYRRFEKGEPNEMWQQDFKGNFALGNGERCHPLNITDDCSRFCLCSEALCGERLEDVWPVMLRVFGEYGLPRILLCDNGNPWGVTQKQGFTVFEVRLMDLGVLTVHGRAWHPQTQGKQERFNGTLTRELLRGREWEDMEKMQAALTEYRAFYNQVRPHHALSLETPASRYEHSQRQLPARIKPWEYGEGYQVRRIRGNGYLSYQGHSYFLSEAFAGKEVGIRASRKAGCVTVEYRRFKIARMNLGTKTCEDRRAYLCSGDPRESLG